MGSDNSSEVDSLRYTIENMKKDQEKKEKEEKERKEEINTK